MTSFGMKYKNYGIDGQLLLCIKSLYCKLKTICWENDKQLRPFDMSFDLKQVCFFTFLL